MPGELPVLDPAEQRVLGSLLEKEVTVPASYPMTLAGLRTACNQASSREPVTAYEEAEIVEVLKRLKERDLVGVTWADRGRRTLKYVERLAVTLELADDHRALLTVLLLRGAQPPGALRSRTERLHAFADRADVEAALTAMAALEVPLVEQLPRAPREQDHRWRHLLGDAEAEVDAAGAAGAAAATDRESVLAAGGDARDATVRSTYDAVAAAYAERFATELDDLPFERWLLTRAAWLAGERPAVEVGCGPGQVTAFLADCGVEATGIDLSPAMVAQARERFAEGRYEVGDLRRLMRPTSADGWGAVLAWYSLIHLAPSELGDAVGALVRPLAPGGWLLLALHAGADLRAPGSWFDVPTELNLVFHRPEEVLAAVEAAGLVDVEWYLRGPLLGREETTDRLYVLARRH